MSDIFLIEMRKFVCLCEFCIDANGMEVDHCVNNAYVKQWKYVPLNLKGPHPILTWKEMHADEAVVSLDHDRVFDLVKQGRCSFINEIWVSFHMCIQVSNS